MSSIYHDILSAQADMLPFLFEKMARPHIKTAEAGENILKALGPKMAIGALLGGAAGAGGTAMAQDDSLQAGETPDEAVKRRNKEKIVAALMGSLAGGAAPLGYEYFAHNTTPTDKTIHNEAPATINAWRSVTAPAGALLGGAAGLERARLGWSQLPNIAHSSGIGKAMRKAPGLWKPVAAMLAGGWIGDKLPSLPTLGGGSGDSSLLKTPAGPWLAGKLGL